MRLDLMNPVNMRRTAVYRGAARGLGPWQIMESQPPQHELPRKCACETKCYDNLNDSAMSGTSYDIGHTEPAIKRQRADDIFNMVIRMNVPMERPYMTLCTATVNTPLYCMDSTRAKQAWDAQGLQRPM